MGSYKDYMFICKLMLVSLSLIVLTSCANKSGKNNSGPSLSQVENEIQQSAPAEDIDTRLRNLEKPSADEIKKLGDSLAKADGDRVFGDIRFGMSRKEYNKAYKDVEKAFVSRIYIDCSNMSSYHQPNDFFWIDSIKPAFHDGKLWSILFYGVMNDYGKSEYKQIKGSFDALKEMFVRKYGTPHYIDCDYDKPGTNAIYPIRSIEWRLNMLRIYDTKTQAIVDKESEIQREKLKEGIKKELEKIHKENEKRKEIQQSL